MLPYYLRKLLREFGHRMPAHSWKGFLLIERGSLDTEELRRAVMEGFLTPVGAMDGKIYSTHEYHRVLHKAAPDWESTAKYLFFYRLTPSGIMAGIAMGATYQDPHAGVVKLADTRGSSPRAGKPRAGSTPAAGTSSKRSSISVA